jgi:hypothetical protein
MATTTQKQKEAVDWFIGRARSASGYRDNIFNKTDRMRNTPTIGKMFFFSYDPKHKKKLPMWDKYPLVFPIEPYSDGFLGLNTHYLSLGFREAFLTRLKEFATAKNLTEKSRLQISYDLISSTKRLSGLANPCIKRYLFTHVRSPFIEIVATEWDKVINLPIESFIYRT